ncbi:DUF2145 domain-containing protein [Roseateles koreensis]|uniref:DUF2145 domain-containing protein n=1 Tax=Roseateles koreensis TaxID=2987526 RepID=A0ABT5KMQ3_9BURK|nr:DUF2145 domain-containing protein [Roseateles koreensis]MDC8784202.1 DUF2145 domain-containing protein [Roseateles koreensis]
MRLADVVRRELALSGQRVALLSRSGLDLSHFGLRYSHAGLSLQGSGNAPWSVRQLYYACEEQRPRLYDQGLAGFVLGADDAREAYVSLVFFPEAQALPLERAALDKRLSLQLLSPRYSANAYPFSQRYQNCNQWVAELMASAWAEPAGDGVAGEDSTVKSDAGDGTGQSAGPGAEVRARAQRWLSMNNYQPTVMAPDWPVLMWLGALIPWIHSDDHPLEDLRQPQFRVSMPASLEAFVQAQMPGASRVELCQTANRIVIHRGWRPIDPGCQAGAQDEVITLN